MIDITRDACLRGEVVCRADWNDAERRVESVEAVQDFVHGAVAANRDHSVRTSPRGGSGHCRAVALLERDVWLDVMSLTADPIDEMAHVFTLGARAVNDHREVLALTTNHRDSSSSGLRFLASTRQMTRGLAPRASDG